MNWLLVGIVTVTIIVVLEVAWLVPYCIAQGWYLGKMRALRKARKENSK